MNSQARFSSGTRGGGRKTGEGGVGGDRGRVDKDDFVLKCPRPNFPLGLIPPSIRKPQPISLAHHQELGQGKGWGREGCTEQHSHWVLKGPELGLSALARLRLFQD